MLLQRIEPALAPQFVVQDGQSCPFVDTVAGNPKCRIRTNDAGITIKSNLKDSVTTHVWPSSPPSWCPLRSDVIVVRLGES